MKRAKFKRLAKKSLKLEPSLIDITNNDKLMGRVLKKSAEMQEKTLKEAEKKEEEERWQR